MAWIAEGMLSVMDMVVGLVKIWVGVCHWCASLRSNKVYWQRKNKIKNLLLLLKTN